MPFGNLPKTRICLDPILRLENYFRNFMISLTVYALVWVSCLVTNRLGRIFLTRPTEVMWQSVDRVRRGRKGRISSQLILARLDNMLSKKKPQMKTIYYDSVHQPIVAL